MQSFQQSGVYFANSLGKKFKLMPPGQELIALCILRQNEVMIKNQSRSLDEKTASPM